MSSRAGGLLLAWVLLAPGAATRADAPPPFGPRIDLRVAGRVVAARPADVDGDGLLDVLVFWRQGDPPESRGRVSVHRAGPGGPAATPLQVLGLPEGCAAFDVGDADGDGRADVLLLQGDGVYALPGQADGRLAEQPRALLRAPMLAAFPHPDHVPPLELLVDLGAPGKPRRALLAPGLPPGPLTLAEPGPDGAFERRELLRVPTRSNLHTAAEDAHAVREFGALVQFTLPRLRVADQDGDGRADLLFFADDALAVFRARADGGFPRDPDLWRAFGLLSPEERVSRNVFVRGDAADLDGDGRADLMFNKTRGGLASMSAETQLYRAAPDGGYPARPDVRIQSAGFGSAVRLLDVDGDGRTDLVRPHLEVGLVVMSQVLFTGRVGVDFLVHLSRRGLPGPRPDCALAGSLGIDFQSSQEMRGPYPLLGEDFTGDGRADAIVGVAGGGSGDNPDRLDLLPGLAEGCFDDDASWSLELPGTRNVGAYRVRAGGSPGLILFFSQGTTHRGDVWVFPPRP
ncbi:MAG TPA: VCBS repeat-containing protein [Myxococcota bacterium]|nr:VCBS repeat-containing protein [Myxococcota bacterium]HRY92950.1 VCBS repeat-containing protein [Myxococcota bacterium]HSA21257.1 VCBS repeat-containing protein [Myxococcota bacterium]